MATQRDTKSKGKRHREDFESREQSGSLHVGFGSHGNPATLGSEDREGSSAGQEAHLQASTTDVETIPEDVRGWYAGLQQARHSIKDFERHSSSVEGRAPSFYLSDSCSQPVREL